MPAQFAHQLELIDRLTAVKAPRHATCLLHVIHSRQHGGGLRLYPVRGQKGADNLELDNNTAERCMRAIALGRKNDLFVGSEAGGKAAAITYTLIETAKLYAVDPNAWLADYKINKVDGLLPWRWERQRSDRTVTHMGRSRTVQEIE